jgi:hypothetical protein
MITIQKIREMEDQKKKIKKEIYKKIYEQFNRKIQNSVLCHQKNVLLQVPAFLLGYPTFEQEHAASYLKRQLENAGFVVEYMSNTSFHVSWEKQSKQPELPSYEFEQKPKKKKENPEEEYFPSLLNLKKVANKYRDMKGERAP